jgi:hypothetical protein
LLTTVLHSKGGSKLRISALSLSIYARGKSPFVGLPVCDDGGRRPALFLRKHFVAAIGGGVTFVKYDHEKQTLVIRGVRSSYTLRDLSANANGYQLWQIKDTLTKWAGSKRKTAQRKALAGKRASNHETKSRGCQARTTGREDWRAQTSESVRSRST